jgi:xanthine dehydrogenase accessory factor
MTGNKAGCNYTLASTLTALTEALEQQHPCAFCTVVETHGSTPQKPGAAMLVGPNGQQNGTVGGGLVEEEVKTYVLRVLAGSSVPEVLHFRLDDESTCADGPICGGRMSVLVDPLNTAGSFAYFRRFREQVEQGQGCTEVIAINAEAARRVGSRYLFDEQGRPAVQRADGPLPEILNHSVQPLESRPGPTVQHGHAFLPILPRITLLIVGGGHIGQAVARLAAEVDFDIWVLDDRATFANRQRFPSAQRLMVSPIGPALQEMASNLVTPSTYCIIVTRGHHHDGEALYHLAPTRAGYVGMIGSQSKVRMLQADLVAKGLAPEVLARVRAPLGLDIGSQTVPEIAVSIVAELIARRNLGPCFRSSAVLRRFAEA